MTPIRTIAFIGLGHMGVPMAERLASEGFALALYDRRPDAAPAFAAVHGGRPATSPADAARGVDAAICMLPDDAAVREVVLGEGGLVEGLAPGAIVVDMGTSNPKATSEIGAAVARRGIGYVDAPVMGGVVFARDATLDIMAGGAGADIERCMPVFAALGRHVFRCGKLGSGHALKVLANYVNACTLINVIEALAIGRAYGLDSLAMAEAMKQMCCGRQHPLEKKVMTQVLTHKYATGMALGLIAKDVSIAVDFGQSVGAMTPLADRVCEIWGKAEAAFGGDADHTEVARLWEQGNGARL